MNVKRMLRRLGLGMVPDLGRAGGAGDMPGAPCLPRSRLPPLFFLHIPKSSGSSVNSFLRTLYGRGNFAEHVEHRLPALLSGEAPPLRVDGVSGHVPPCRWSLYPGAGRYAWMTVLRDPWERLVSHVNWVHRFNIDKTLPPPISTRARANHAVAAILRTADFDSAPGLEAFFRAVQAVPDFVGFDNLQERLLLTASTLDETRVLVPEDARRAVANLARFRIVGFCEDQAAFQQAVLDHLGLRDTPRAIRENTGVSPVLTADNTTARSVLAPWFALDARLVEAARTGAPRS